MDQYQCRGVRADAEEGGMPEAQHTGIAENQVEAGREQAQDQDFGKDKHIEIGSNPGHCNQPGDHHSQNGHQNLGLHAVAPLPMMPVGLNNRTSAMPTNGNSRFTSGR